MPRLLSVNVGLPRDIAWRGETVRTATTLLLEAHLMIVQPDRYLNEFAQAGADLIIVHQEATVHLRSFDPIHQTSRQEGWCCDLSLHPCERAGGRNRRTGPGAGDDRRSRVWRAGDVGWGLTAR